MLSGIQIAARLTDIVDDCNPVITFHRPCRNVNADFVLWRKEYAGGTKRLIELRSPIITWSLPGEGPEFAQGKAGHGATVG